MITAYIALGSNLGDRSANLASGLEALARLSGVEVLRVSRIMESPPAGGPPQGDYLNAVAEIRTGRQPEDLLSAMLDIEAGHGRQRGVPDGPRTLDLDLIFYGNRISSTPGLKIPHPRMQDRVFVLRPLAELVPDFIHPLSGKTIRELLEELP